jgi:MYXO-CTERM domain-containing protein
VIDTDGDGLGDKLETETFHTKANDADSDDDGLFDGLEHNPSCDTDGDGLVNVLDVDSDNDALFDGLEAGKDCGNPDTDASKKHCHFDGDPSTTTSVLLRDTDHGGVIDGSEDGNLNGVVGVSELDPNVMDDDVSAVDSDGDGLSDDLEARLGSDPNDKDSDDDGVLDGDEANPSDDADGDGQLNIMDPDADGDGVFDGTELGLDCNNAATDQSQMRCFPDGDGGATKTNPLLADTDGGGATDGQEDTNHNGVVDAGETDPNKAGDDIIPECLTDKDCDAGKVCDKQACVSGCRGSNPNTCPMGQTCTSTDETIGECTGGTGGAGGGTNTGATGGTGIAPSADCGCRTAGSPDSGPLGLLALAGVAALATARRRRRR